MCEENDRDGIECNNECSNCNEDAYIDMLDDVYGDVVIGSLKYSTGRVLKEIDPIAFNCGMSDEECICEKADK